jgi:hypothetical protein
MAAPSDRFRYRPAVVEDPPVMQRLKHGFVVPLTALRLAWRLEDAGCVLKADGDRLVIEPATRLTEADRADVARWREDLKAIARYRAEVE